MDEETPCPYCGDVPQVTVDSDGNTWRCWPKCDGSCNKERSKDVATVGKGSMMPVHIFKDKDWIYLESGDSTIMFDWELLQGLINELQLLRLEAQMKGKGT